MENLSYVLAVIVIIVIIIIIIGFICWRLGVDHQTNTTGQVCVIDSDCGPGHYCGGGNQCSVGVAGGTVGAICSLNAHCKVGLLCKKNSGDTVMRCSR